MNFLSAEYTKQATEHSITKPILRPARAEDVAAITKIYNQAVRERIATCDEDEKTHEERTQWFKQFDQRNPIFVAEQNQEVIAYCCLFKYSPKSGYRFATEVSLYIDKDHRGQGLGKHLLSHLLVTAKNLGYKYVEARVFEHNEPSLALHKKAGFKIVGVQDRIANLDGQWFNNVILNLHI